MPPFYTPFALLHTSAKKTPSITLRPKVAIFLGDVRDLEALSLDSLPFSVSVGEIVTKDVLIITYYTCRLLFTRKKSH